MYGLSGSGEFHHLDHIIVLMRFVRVSLIDWLVKNHLNNYDR